MDVEDQPLGVDIGGCIRTWTARRGLLALTESLNSRKLILTGAVPDGSRHLRIVNSRHRPRRVGIHDNTYRLVHSPNERRRWKPRKVAFLVGGHRHRFKIAGIGLQHGTGAWTAGGPLLRP